MCAPEWQREPDRVGVLLDRGLGDLLGGLVQAGVDDLEPGVAQRPRDDLGAPVVPVEPGLGDDHTLFVRHRAESIERQVALRCAAGRDPPVRAPEVHYAKTPQGVHIAYQVVGDGPLDLLFAPGYASNLQWQWELPSYARFLERLASFARLIVVDRRGAGLSDRFSPRTLPRSRTSPTTSRSCWTRWARSEPRCSARRTGA